MLLGLDVPTGGTAAEPTMVKVAGRAPLEADLTVYLDGTATGSDADRQDDVLHAIDRLTEAGILTDPAIRDWRDCDVDARLAEFRGAVADGAFEPFVEERPDGTGVEMPDVFVAIRRDGELTGLYPRRKGGTDQTVEDCVRALCSGDRVENLE